MAEPLPPVRVLRFVREQPWALLESYFDTMLDVLEMRASGLRFSAEEAAQRVEAGRRSTPTATAPGSIAVLPLFGLMAQRAGHFDVSQEGTSTEEFAAVFRQAMVDPSIGAVVLNVDSPGGSVFGVQELADVIASSRGQKPMVAVANSLAASAAYWVASQADELVVTPSGEVGSIGVIAAHDDISKAAEAKGVKRTYVTAPVGGFKAEGNPFEPLSDEASAHLQSRVDDYYDRFVRAVAAGRRTSLATVREDFGKGRTVGGRQAVELGMADRVATLQETVDRLAAKLAKSGSRAKAVARLQLTEAGG